MVKTAVIGATGYAGAELVRILTGHPEVDLIAVTSRQYAGIPFAEVYPSMQGVVDLVCAEQSVKDICKQADIVFLALPHKLPMGLVPELIDNGKKVIDLSADFRFKNADKYEACYQPHTAKKLLGKAVYGLCEIYHDDIKGSQLVGNPGCYPTSTLLPLIPLLKSGFLDTTSIIVDSKSGTSGAGRSLSLNTHFCEVNESFKAYKVTEHRHTPEMEEILTAEAGKSVTITFVPHLVPATRGMLTTIYASLAKKAELKDIMDCLASFYSNSPFVRICPVNTLPNISHVRCTNYCDIGIKIDEQNSRVILVSVIDNLVKGAAGQAVQNMNIMMGIDEKKGLDNIPFPV